MSLDVSLYANRPVEVFEQNITHNLVQMARAAGIYWACWRPEELGCDGFDEKGFVKNLTAADLIPLLTEGLEELKSDPEHFKQYDAENGWGLYEHFVPFVETYLAACVENPDALVRVSR